jgi:hypothetical protein
MRRAGWNPTRRNRNIGTAKSGHGLDNSLVIPSPRYESWVFWQNLDGGPTAGADRRGLNANEWFAVSP